MPHRPIGPDVDLETEDIRTADGRRLTDDLAAEIAERAVAAARGRGRPSVSGEPARTPNLTIRVPPALRSSLQRIAEREGVRLADVGREALVEYVKRHSAVRTVVKAAPVKRAGVVRAAPVKAAPVKRAGVVRAAPVKVAPVKKAGVVRAAAPVKKAAVVRAVAAKKATAGTTKAKAPSPKSSRTR